MKAFDFAAMILWVSSHKQLTLTLCGLVLCVVSVGTIVLCTSLPVQEANPCIYLVLPRCAAVTMYCTVDCPTFSFLSK